MPSLTRLLAVALLLGTALLGVGAAVHPMLTGDPAADLRIIAATPHWRAIHLALLAGSGLVIIGIWVRLAREQSGPRAPVLAALAVIALGEALNALNTAFMAGAGWRMATRFQEGAPAMPQLFDATHPIGLVAARFGNLLVALGAGALGWAEWEDRAQPRLLPTLAWIAAAGGIVGVCFYDEASRAALAAVALLSGWQIVTAARTLENN